MAGGMQQALGGILSTRGLDLGPVHTRQQQQQIAQQGQGLALEQAHMDEQARQFNETMKAQKRESQLDRNAQRDLQLLQQQGRMDIQALDIAANKALQTSQIVAERAAQESSQEFQMQKQAELLEQDTAKFEKTFGEQTKMGDARRAQMTRQGRIEEHRISIEEEIAGLKAALITRETENMPSSEEARTQRQLKNRIMQLEVQKAEYALEGMDDPEAKIMRNNLRILREEIEEATLERQLEDVQKPEGTQAFRAAEEEIAGAKARRAEAEERTERSKQERAMSKAMADQYGVVWDEETGTFKKVGKAEVSAEMTEQEVEDAETAADELDQHYEGIDVHKDDDIVVARDAGYKMLEMWRKDDSPMTNRARERVRNFLEKTKNLEGRDDMEFAALADHGFDAKEIRILEKLFDAFEG